MKHKVKHLHFIAVNARNCETIARGGPTRAMYPARVATDATSRMVRDAA